MVLGPIVDAVSYIFAPTVIIAPFACLDVILNLITAPVTLAFQKERLTKQHVFGALLVTAGSVCTSVFGSAQDSDPSVDQIVAQLTRTPSLIYFGCEVAVIASLSALLRSGRLPKELSGISMGVIAGILMGNVFCMKGFMTVLQGTINGDPAAQEEWRTPTPYVLATVALGGALVANMVLTKGLRQHKGVFMVTIFEGSHISAACISGAVVMSELHGLTWTCYVLYWTGVGLIISGMLVINSASSSARGRTRTRSSFLLEDVAEDRFISQHVSFKASYFLDGPFSSRSLPEEPLQRAATTALSQERRSWFRRGSGSPRAEPALSQELVDARPPHRAATTPM